MTRYYRDVIVHHFREETGFMTGDQDAYRMNLNRLLATITEEYNKNINILPI